MSAPPGADATALAQWAWNKWERSEETTATAIAEVARRIQQYGDERERVAREAAIEEPPFQPTPELIASLETLALHVPPLFVGGPVRTSVLGMELEQWRCESATAEFGLGPDWATLYGIRSTAPGRGHATRLLIEARRHYQLAGKRFGSSVALNPRMRAILQRLEITEYQ